jgi:hypothetical protein
MGMGLEWAKLEQIVWQRDGSDAETIIKHFYTGVEVETGKL